MTFKSNKAGLLFAPFLVLILLHCGPSSVDEAFNDPMLEILADWRPVEGRIVGGFSHVAYNRERNPYIRQKRISAIAATERKFRAAYDVNRDLEGLYSLARMDLIRSRHRAAIERLEIALARSPGSQKIGNDLAVACLEGRREDPLLLLRALEVIDAVVKQGNASPESLFNYALILQELQFPAAALEAWAVYLKAESDNAWQEEARQRMGQISKPTMSDHWEQLKPLLLREDFSPDLVLDAAARFPQHAREYGEQLFLEASYAKKEDVGAKKLNLARAIGLALSDFYEDTLLLHALEQPVEHWREGLELYQQGRTLSELRQYTKAGACFQRALDKLIGHPFWYWAAYYLAECDFQIRCYARATALLEAIDAHCQNPYWSWRARVFGLRGLIAGVGGNLSAYLKLCMDAADFTQSANETPNETRVRKNIAGAWAGLGFNHRGKKAYLETLSLLKDWPDARNSHVIYGGLARCLMEDGRYQAAQYFIDEMLENVKARNRNASTAQALRFRAYNQFLLGHKKQALGDLDLAEDHLAGVPDGKTLKNVEAEIALARGRIHTANAPAKALEALELAYEIHREDNINIRLPEIVLWQARALRNAGLKTQAKEKLGEGIQRIEDMRTQVIAMQNRISFFDHSLALYQEMVELLVEDGAYDEALLISEKKRARFLMDQLDKKGLDRSKPWRDAQDPKTVLDLIPQDTAIIYFSMVNHGLKVWVLKDRRVTDVWVGLDRNDLKAELTLLETVFRSEMVETEAPPVLEKLFQMVLAPVIGEVSGKETLVLAPDQEMWSIPFSALMQNGQYLVENYALSTIPSLAHYQSSVLRSKQWSDDPKSLLAIGNPSFNRRLFPEKQPLRWAETAVEKIGTYAEKTILMRKEATAARLFELGGNAEVIHIAAHAEIHERFQLWSKLLMAPADGDDGVLQAQDIYGRHFDKTRLVVLAACNSGRAGESSSERGGDLGRSFLGAGVPSVIAALRLVDDKASMAFSIALHKQISQGLSPANALRAAKVQLLREAGPNLNAKSVWPFYQVFGAP